MIKAMSATAMPETREGPFLQCFQLWQKLHRQIGGVGFHFVTNQLNVANYRLDYLHKVDDTVLLIKRALIHGLEQNVNRLGRCWFLWW